MAILTSLVPSRDISFLLALDKLDRMCISDVLLGHTRALNEIN